MNNSLTNTGRLLAAGLRALLVLTLVTGVVYPLAVTGVAQGLFPGRANGSETVADGRVVGSSLIGQSYDLPLKKGRRAPEADLKWFQGRPADGLGTNSVNTRYRLLVSGATNLSADSAELIQQVEDARKAVVKDNSVPGYTVRPRTSPPTRSPPPARASTPTYRLSTRASRCTGSRRRTGCPSRRWRGSSRSTPRAARSASWASPG